MTDSQLQAQAEVLARCVQSLGRAMDTVSDCVDALTMVGLSDEAATVLGMFHTVTADRIWLRARFHQTRSRAALAAGQPHLHTVGGE